MNIKYEGKWQDTAGNQHIIQILTNDVVSTIINIKVNECTFESPDNYLFGEDVCNGCGGEITIISPSRLYFEGLFTSDIFKYQFKHFINNGLHFNGYVDSENYSEKLSDIKNYLISFKVNDGIALMERINYSATPIVGIDSALNIIKNCLLKLNISFDKIYIALTTSAPNTVSTTILHHLYCNNANYFDEKGKSLTIREVINAILFPLTARLFFYQNSVYIIDVNAFGVSDKYGGLSFKTYYFNTLLFIENKFHEIKININELYNGNDGFGYKEGLNQINLKFNKYNYENNIDFKINAENISDLISTQTLNKDDKTYTQNIYSQCESLVSNSANLQFVQQIDNEDNEEYYLRFIPSLAAPVGLYNVKMEGNSIFTLNTNMFMTSSQLVMKIEFDFMVEDLTRFKEEYECQVGAFGRGVCIKTNIGNYFQDVFGWTLNGNGYFLHDWGSTVYSEKVTANKWIKCYQYIPLNNDMFESNKTITNAGGLLTLNYNACNLGVTKLKWCMKNFKITFNEKDEFLYIPTKLTDKELTGYLNPTYKNDRDVEILHGSDPSSNSRGAFLVNVTGLYSDSVFATNQRIVSLNKVKKTTETGTVSATIEELFLNTYLSNFEYARKTLTGTLLGYYKPFNIFSYRLIKRDDFVCNLLPSSITIDYINAQTELNLVEFVGDKLTIINE